MIQAFPIHGLSQIRDIDALLCACVELGLKLQPDFHCRGYAGVTRRAPYVIQLKGPYDIAVDPSPEKDGSYGLTTDWWDGHAFKGRKGTRRGRVVHGCE